MWNDSKGLTVSCINGLKRSTKSNTSTYLRFRSSCLICVRMKKLPCLHEEFINGCMVCEYAKKQPLRIETKPSIPLPVLAKCRYRSDNPIEFCTSCSGGNNHIYDCEVYERCREFPRHGDRIQICSVCPSHSERRDESGDGKNPS